jgi:hypothetical protein
MGLLSVVVLLALASSLGAQAEPAADRIYGRVLTASGERLEGYLRWDRNETQWADILDGQKEIPWEWMREAERLDENYRRRRERERSITILGVRISWDEDDEEPPTTTSAGVRFGHLSALEVLDDRRVLLVLKSGEEVELSASSSDIGRSFRELVVEDLERGEVELRWRDLDRIDFAPAPPGRAAPAAARLHGTLRTQAGLELTGFVAWDMDETLATDVLDAEEEGRERDVTFADIASIERESSRSARVVLRSGQELILRGTNDVNDDNRGIEISDPSLGRVIVSWDELQALTFHAPDAVAGYDAFGGGRPLQGTVETVDGDRLTGTIRWDNDEESTWEILDGRSDGVDYDIELAHVRTIERVGSSAARVGLRDGRTLLLEGSNDVDETNKGIFVRLESGRTMLVRWAELERVTFEE